MTETVSLMTFAEADANVSAKLATNHNRETQNEQHRDSTRNVAYSLTGCYSTLRNTTPSSNITITGPADWHDLVGWSASGPSQDVVPSTTNGTHTIPVHGDGVYVIDFNVTIQRITISSTAEFFVRAVKNGTTEILISQETITADNLYRGISGHSLVSLVAGDVVKLQVVELTGAVVKFAGGDFTINRKK